MPRRSRVVLAIAGLYVLGLGLIGLWPRHVDQDLDIIGSPPVRWVVEGLSMSLIQAYDVVEFTANIALFVPFGALTMVWWPRLRWPNAAGAGVALSAGIELLQWAARPGRTASASDVVANGLGALLGALLVTGARRWLWRSGDS